MSDISEHKAAIVVAAITPTQDRHLFPTVSKVRVQNTSPWRDSGRVVQLAFMCELERVRRDISTKVKRRMVTCDLREMSDVKR